MAAVRRLCQWSTSTTTSSRPVLLSSPSSPRSIRHSKLTSNLNNRRLSTSTLPSPLRVGRHCRIAGCQARRQLAPLFQPQLPLHFYSSSSSSPSPSSSPLPPQSRASPSIPTSLPSFKTNLQAPPTSSSSMVAENYDQVLKGKYPGKAHARRVVQLLREQVPDVNGVLYVEGRSTILREDDDSPIAFRQRRWFYYLTGCDLADCQFVYDIQADKSTLFIPAIDPDDVIWSGLPVSIDDALGMFDVDEVKLSPEVNPTLAHLGTTYPKATVYAIANQVSDSTTFLEFAHKDFDLLKHTISVARVVKDEYEVALIRKANHITGLAHKAVLQRAKKAANERELEAAFLERCVSLGAPNMSYPPILASGRSAATLHYVGNDAPLDGKLNLLIDAGGEYNNYTSDITRTFPLSGKFTHESRQIYDIAFKMQEVCIAAIKAGVNWDDIHLLAHKTAIDGLLAIGVLQGDKEEIVKAQTSAAFFPHGLGHYLGMDTHDKGGNPNAKDPNRLFRYLRLRGVVPAGSVVTVEPGVYFCEFIIQPYLEDPAHSKFINKDVLDKYWDVGGVRIEDNVLVTENGCENLSQAIKIPGEVEATVQSG